MKLPYSGEPWQYWKWKLFLASGSETRKSLFLPALHDSVCSLVSSSSD